MASWLRTVARNPLGVVYLPHEVTHFLFILPWSETVRVELASGPGREDERYLPAPAVVTGDIADDTPVLAIRLAAVAPLLVFGTVATVLGHHLDISTTGGLGVGVLVVVFFTWARLSGPDLAAFQNARMVRDSGQLGGVRCSARHLAGSIMLSFVLVFYLLSIFLF